MLGADEMAWRSWNAKDTLLFLETSRSGSAHGSSHSTWSATRKEH
jgi:hypothetical protein